MKKHTSNALASNALFPNFQPVWHLASICRFSALLLCGGLLLGPLAAWSQNYSITTGGGALVITDNSNNSDILLVLENGTSVEFNVTVTPRTYSLNGGAVTNMPAVIPLTGVTSITINTKGGNDNVNFGLFTANTLPSVTVNGGTGDDKVTFFDDITFTANANLDLDLQNDDAPVGTDIVELNANANILLSGTGAAVIKASKTVKVGNGASLVTVNGDMTVEANQQASASTGGFSGVDLNNGLLQASGTGNVTIKGKGGTGGAFNVGVNLGGANAKITSVGGNVNVTGTGGAVSGSLADIGVALQTSSTISVGGNGSLTVTGFGGTSTTGSFNHGVLVNSGSKILSTNGNTTVTGTGGGTGSISDKNYGVAVALASSISASGTGGVTVMGTGGTTTGKDNVGVYVADANSKITSAGGNVSVTGQGKGSGSGSTYNHGVYVVDAAQITADGASNTVTVMGTGGAAGGNFNYGVFVEKANSKITSAGGNVSVTGQGGGSGASSGNNLGVFLDVSGTITAGLNGTVTINGTGGASGGNFNVGVFSGTNATITSSGGNVSVTGIGGGSGTSSNNLGVYVFGAGIISAGTNGSVTVMGTGGATGGTSYGVNINGTNSRITSSGGNVSVTGQGGGAAGFNNNHGVIVELAGAISAGSTGTVTVQGTGGATDGGNNYGVYLEDASTTITSSGGNVSVTGQGGGSGASDFNHGVVIVGGEITAASNGTVTVMGTGASVGGTNYGVLVNGANAQVTSSGGAVSVTGQGGGSGASDLNFGVLVFSGGKITAGGNGTVSVQGTGGSSTGAGNFGVRVVNGGSLITSSGGDVSVTGIEGGGFSGVGIVTEYSGSITTVPSGGKITLIANSMIINAGVSTPSGNSATLRPYTNGVQINLGTALNPIGGPLGLSDTELDLITTGTLVIGNANSGNITVSAAITRPANTAVQLVTAGDITLNQGINTAGGNLLLDCGTSPKAIYPTFNGTDADLGAGTLSFASDIAFAINGTTPGDGTGATYTQIVVNGSVNLTGHTLALSGAYTETVGDMITLVVNDGADPVIGTFSGLAEGALVNTGPFDNRWAKISYVGGTGNDVVLTVVAADYTITSGADLTITDDAGNGDQLDATEDGAGIKFATTPARTYALNGGATMLFPVTVANVANFNNITINTKAGDDLNNLGAFTAALKNLTINGGTGDDAVNFNGDITFAGNANLDVDLQNDDAPVGVDNVTVAANANLVLSGTGAATVKVSKNVLVSSGGSIETADGNLTVEANQQLTGTTGGFEGVALDGGLLKTSGSGTLTVKGKGGTINSSKIGVYLYNGGKIDGGSATVTVEGRGVGAATSNNHGVSIEGANARVSSTGGNVSVIGFGGGSGAGAANNRGVVLTGGAQISAGGSGTVTVGGSGGNNAQGNNNDGVLVAGADSKIFSNNGDVSVTGAGGGTGASSRSNYGVSLNTGGQISSGGISTLVVNGSGGAGSAATSSNYGVSVADANSKIAAGGNLLVTGTGGTAGTHNYGVNVAGSGQITSNSSGTVSVTGNGGSGQNSYGTFVSGSGSLITSGDGNVTVQGTGGSTGSSQFGTYVFDGGSISAGGLGNVSVTGTAGATSGFTKYGVYLNSNNASITSGGGNVTVTGIEGGSGAGTGFGFVSENTGTVTTAANGGNVTVIANSMLIGGPISTNAAGQTTLRQNTNNVAIDLGDATDTKGGPLKLSDTELDLVTTGTLVIGNANSGNITVSAAITRPANTAVQLVTAGDITLSGGGINTAGGNLLLDCGTSPKAIYPTFNGTDADLGTSTLSFASDLAFAINGTTPGDGTGTTYSQLKVVGSVNLTGVNLVISGSHIPIVGQTFVLVDNDGLDDVLGTFFGLPQNGIISNFLGSGLNASISYTGNDGNDVVLTVCPPLTITCPAGSPFARNTDADQCNYTIQAMEFDPAFGDNCPGATITNDFNNMNTLAGEDLPKGPTTITWTVTDGMNMASTTCQITVNVTDNQPPTITCPAGSPLARNTDAGQCNYTVQATEFDPAFGDNCPGATITNNFNNTATLAGEDFPKGPTTITWTVTDGMNMASTTCQITVNVTDNQPPTITCPAPVAVTCASQIPAVNLAAVTATDNCDTPTKSHVGDVPTNITCANRFTVTRIYRATDGTGNSTTCSQVITVFDNVQPTFTFVPANVTVQCNSIPAAGAPTASDGCGGSVSIAYDGQTVSNILCTDKYTLTRQWTATDACGNTKTATQRITVIDSQLPNFTLTPANVTVQCDAIPAVATPTATDNCDATVAISYIGQTTTAGACANAYTLTRRWVASDNCNNTRSISQRITVVDNGKPVFTSFPANTNIACHETPPAVGSPTASDACGSATVTYLGQTSVSGTCPGNYQIRRTWRATDACGNSTAATQTIQVSDSDLPVFTSTPGPITIECGDPLPPLVNPTASDACGGYVHITFLGNVPSGSGCAADYTITRTWRADDLCGNTATTTQLITVLGNNNAEAEGAENRNEDATILIAHRSSLIINPNPTTDRFWLDLSDYAGEAVTVSIHSDLGQLVWERKIPAVEDLKLSVSLREAGAAAGIYTVSVRGANGLVAKRVVLVE